MKYIGLLVYWLISYYYFKKNKDKSLKEYMSDKWIIHLSNNFFYIILFFILPYWYIWLYSRAENFAIIELFDITNIIQLYGLEALCFLLFILIYFFLPLIFIIHREFLLSCLSLICLSILIFSLMHFYYNDKYAVCGVIIFWFSITIIVMENMVILEKNLTLENNKNFQEKSKIHSEIINVYIKIKEKFISKINCLYPLTILVSSFLLLGNPYWTNNGLTKIILRNANIGNFQAQFYNVNNHEQIIDGCLLLRTKDNFYIKKESENIIYSTQNYSIKYTHQDKCK